MNSSIKEYTVPVDQTDKASNLCSHLMVYAVQLMDAVRGLAGLKDQKESAGVNFTSSEIEAEIAASRVLHHTQGSDWNNVLSSSAAVKAWIEANFHDDIFEKVRP